MTTFFVIAAFTGGYVAAVYSWDKAKALTTSLKEKVSAVYTKIKSVFGGA